MDYRGARFYDSDMGRFLSLDPLAVKFPSWSPYNYVFGNPIVYTDPTGREPESIKDEVKETRWTENHKRLNEIFGDNYGFNSHIEKANSEQGGLPSFLRTKENI